jgi:Fic-DOC domain mobile mystery protein B
MIEGQDPDGATPLGPDEKSGLMHPHVATKAELNELENANILQGLAWLNSLPKVTTDVVLSRDFVIELHKRMFGDTWLWAGVYRQREMNIGCDPLQVGPNLHNLIEDIKCWIEFDHYPSLEVSARIQHRLVLIHPFANGNGRHSRIFTDCIRHFSLGLPPLVWAAGNLDQQNEERKNYIRGLQQADAGDYEPFIEYLRDKGNTK